MPVSLKSTFINRFWNQLFFWVTVITSIKAWLKHREHCNKERVLVTINGKEYFAKHIVIKNGHMFIDGHYIGPEDVQKITIDKD